ncbi:MAG: hypothetical protein WD872_07660 [Pirellulaceae bacterium]
MRPLQIEASVGKDGELTLSALPFREGDVVNVSIQLRSSPGQASESHPLEGLPIVYLCPYESATPPEDWDAMNDRP